MGGMRTHISATLVLLDLSGYVGLLLWGTHMVSTGVLRGYGIPLRRALERNLGNRFRAFTMGVAVTTLLQSSTATGLMATSFAAAGVIALAPALAVMLGANVGTALVAQVLSFDVAVIAPPLVLLGVLTFRWFTASRMRNVGRIAIGLGLMLMALSGLQHTLSPVESAPLLRSFIGALSADPVLAVILAALLTWGCHSSVVMVLLVGSLGASHVIGGTETLALVLGANLGGALPAFMHASTREARRLPLGNLIVRLVGVLLVLPWIVPLARVLGRFPLIDARLAVNFHLVFNVLLAAPFLFCVDHGAALLLRLVPDSTRPSDPARPLYLEAAALGSATVALANAARETLRMADMIAVMLRDALAVLRSGDPAKAADIAAADRAVRGLGGAIRRYLVAIGGDQTLDDVREGVKGQEILSAVINFEHISDIVANSLMDFAVKQLKRGQLLSAEEIAAVAAMHAEITDSQALAVAVFLRGNLADAQRLVERKRQFLQMEAQATALSVTQLRDAAARSGGADLIGQAAEESGLVLRIARDLRRVHSHLASFAYPVLRGGRGLEGTAAPG